MTETPVIGKIYGQIPKVMAEIGAVGKDRKNEQQNYKFRGIEDLYNAAHPAMTKHGVFCVPSVVSIEHEMRESRSGSIQTWILMKVAHRFYAEDGSFIEVVTTGEGLDSSDKAANKCLSGAFKYALTELFCIPMADVEDSDRTTPEGGRPVERTAEPRTFKRDDPMPEDQPEAPEKPRRTRKAAEKPAPAATATPATAGTVVYIPKEKQDWLRLKFLDSLPMQFRAGAETFRHGWLKENGYVDPLTGNPTSTVIPASEFTSVARRMLNFASNMTALPDDPPADNEPDSAEDGPDPYDDPVPF